MHDWVMSKGGHPVTLSDLDDTSSEIISAAKNYSVWVLTGDMGAGKTTLIKYICRQLGVEQTVTSPTFSIVNEYTRAGGEPIYHFDFYRMKNEAEAYDIGANEYLDSGRLCLVEWAERAPGLIPKRHFEIKIQPIDQTQRIISYRHHD